MGFARESDGQWVRKVVLERKEAIEPSPPSEFNHVRGVGIISVDRHNGDEPYIYATLQSLFTELPATALVHVFVGNANDAYVSSSVLEDKIGEDFASRVRLVPTSQEISRHFKEQDFSLVERATWNFARALRAFDGEGYYLLTEDDVSWGRRGLAHLDRLVEHSSLKAITAYNWRCERIPGGAAGPFGDISILSVPLAWFPREFSGTQALLFNGDVTADLSQHMMLRLGLRPHDLMIDSYLRARELHLGVAQPSMVQHDGVQTTGLGYHHTSKCFRPIFPALDDNIRY